MTMRRMDQVFAWLLVVGALLHAYGSIDGYPLGSEVLLWSLSGSLAISLAAATNLLRVHRPGDRPLAGLALAGAVGVVAIAFGFGATIGNVVDPRALWHAVCGLALAAFSLRTLALRGSQTVGAMGS